MLTGKGQQSVGLVAGNYAGSNGNVLNPALMANSWLKADISLFSAAVFAENNYFYLPANEAGMLKLVRGIYEFPYFAKPYGKGERNVYSYYDDKSRKNILVNGRITGPSAMFSHHDHVFSVRTGARAVSSTRRLPYDIANFSYYGMDFKPQQNVYYVRSDYNMASMAWYEITLSYATIFKRSHNNHWSVGVSAGPRLGYSGAYITGYDTRYIAYNDSILNVEQLDAELGIALPFDYNEHDIEFQEPYIRGIGLGADVGIVWQFRETPYQKKFPGNFYIKRFENYRVKVGVSLTDIGWIKYNVNAEKHDYDNVHNNWIRVNELDYDNIRDELNTTSEIFYGDQTASLKAKEIKIYLPTALNILVDYHIADWWYVNTILLVPARLYSPMIEMPVVLSVTPRFESKNFEVNIPLVLYDFKYPRFGLAVRLQGLTVGSDNIPSLFGYNDFTGSDFYISYKFNIGNDGKNPFTSKGACYNDWRKVLQKVHK
jgi:hypothetical protein